MAAVCYQALYKSADVQQMLIAHREEELPDAERPTHYAFIACFGFEATGEGQLPMEARLRHFKAFHGLRSGLTPATKLVVERRFRGVPPAGSMFAPALVREASTVLKSRMEGGDFTYEERNEMK